MSTTVTKKLDEIRRGIYGQSVAGKGLPAEPTLKQIGEAVQNNLLETRGFQAHERELADEFYGQGDA